MPAHASTLLSRHTVMHHPVMHRVTLCIVYSACCPVLATHWVCGNQALRRGDQDLQEGCLIPLGKLPPVIEAPEVGASILGNCSSVSASTSYASETSIHEGANKTWHRAAPGGGQSQPSLIAISPASNLQADYDSHNICPYSGYPAWLTSLEARL